MTSKICRFICTLILSVWCANATCGQNFTAADSLTKQGNTYTSRSDARKALERYNGRPLFCGIAVGTDLVGPVMKMAASWNQLEVVGKINLLETYFPVFEMGIGESDYTDDTSLIAYQVKAPYWRIGCDVNFIKNKDTGNRIFGGLRYGFSSYNYNISGPDIIDPTWGTAIPYQLKDLNGNKHWAELVFGLEAKIWRMIHLGWNFRYKFGLSEKHSTHGKPWYVPGYGENKSGTIGATFNLMFDLNL